MPRGFTGTTRAELRAYLGYTAVGVAVVSAEPVSKISHVVEILPVVEPVREILPVDAVPRPPASGLSTPITEVLPTCLTDSKTVNCIVDFVGSGFFQAQKTSANKTQLG